MGTNLRWVNQPGLKYSNCLPIPYNLLMTFSGLPESIKIFGILIPVAVYSALAKWG